MHLIILAEVQKEDPLGYIDNRGPWIPKTENYSHWGAEIQADVYWSLGLLGCAW